MNEINKVACKIINASTCSPMIDARRHFAPAIINYFKKKDAIEKYIAPECVAQWRRSKALRGLGSKSNLGACYRAWEAQ